MNNTAVIATVHESHSSDTIHESHSSDTVESSAFEVEAIATSSIITLVLPSDLKSHQGEVHTDSFPPLLKKPHIERVGGITS